MKEKNKKTPDDGMKVKTHCQYTNLYSLEI